MEEKKLIKQNKKYMSSKVRLDNNLVDILINGHKSLKTVFSFAVLHKVLSIASKERGRNEQVFNLYEFWEEYELTNDIRKDNFKRDVLRDFERMEWKYKSIGYRNGGKTLISFAIFQRTELNKKTGDVWVKLNEDLFESVSNIPEQRYFQFLKSETKLLVDKKMKPKDMKLLLYVKSKTLKKEVSYMKINREKLWEIFGASKTLTISQIKKKYLNPAILNINRSTNYNISIKYSYDKRYRQKIIAVNLIVDNKAERYNELRKLKDSDKEENWYIELMKKYENDNTSEYINDDDFFF